MFNSRRLVENLIFFIVFFSVRKRCLSWELTLFAQDITPFLNGFAKSVPKLVFKDVGKYLNTKRAGIRRQNYSFPFSSLSPPEKKIPKIVKGAGMSVFGQITEQHFHTGHRDAVSRTVARGVIFVIGVQCLPSGSLFFLPFFSSTFFTHLRTLSRRSLPPGSALNCVT